MKFFADTAEIDDIQELTATGLLDGVTTNPSLIAKSGRDFKEVTKEICALTTGPVSAEVVALDHETMMKEAEILRKIAEGQPDQVGDTSTLADPSVVDNLVKTR